MKDKFIEIGASTRGLTVWAEPDQRSGGYVYVHTEPHSRMYNSPSTQRVWLTSLQIHSLTTIIGAYLNGVTDKP